MGLAKFLLPLFSAFALYAIFHFSTENGLFKLVESAVRAKTIPGTDEPLRTVYTGIERLDRTLTTLTVFFWPVADGSRPGLSLHSICFSSALGSAWVLVFLESWRRVNRRTIVSISWIYGILAQLGTYAFAAPLFFTLQSWTSSTKLTAPAISVSLKVLNAVPFIFTIGYTVPSVLMILPTPQFFTVDEKQLLIAAWQPWPIYVSLLAAVVSLLPSPKSEEVAPNSDLRKSLRFVYSYAFANAAIAHVACWTISLATVIVPAIFDAQYIELFHPKNVFGVFLPFWYADLRVQSVAEGVQIFLQWDYLIGSLGVLTWAISSYALAHRNVLGNVDWFSLVFKVVNLSLFTGPVAAAVALIWERDEFILEPAIRSELSKTDKK